MKISFEKITATVAASLMAAASCFASGGGNQAMEARIDSLLSRMTLQEKIGQLNQLNAARFDTLGAAVAQARGFDYQ